MNAKQIAILIVALVLLALILWHDLPIEFPWIVYKVMMLFLKVSAVLIAAILAMVIAGSKKKSSSANKQ